MVEKGAPVYRIVKDDTWNILIKLNKSQYNKLKENKLEFELNANIEEMRSLGFKSAPMLKVNDKFLNFKQAFKWINEVNYER